MNAQLEIGELVSRYPAAAKVFHRYGLDFCCGGKQNFAQVCEEKNLMPEKLMEEIKASESENKSDIRWDEQPFDKLINHILKNFHQPLREELPRLISLAQSVEHAHDDKPDVPKGLSGHLQNIHEAVKSHLEKEEQILFPLILSGRGGMAQMPIKVMIQEHEDHGSNLQLTREITNNFHLPEYACNSWKELYRSLDQLEQDLMVHIHLENNILFPRVLAQ